MTNKSNRRDFLKIIGVGSLGLALSNSTVFGQKAKKHCVVIGSGFAGLSAAFRIKNEGWKVTVLEARDRIGGRVFSHRMPQNSNLICELGAEWVGESHERLKALCKDFNIPLQKHQFDDYLLQNGKVSRPNEWGFSPAAKAAFEKTIKQYENFTQAKKNQIDRLDWWTFLESLGFSPEDLRLRDLMDSTDFGESIRHVSAFAALAEYAESSPKNEMDYKMTGGNSRLTEEFVKRIGMENIRLKSPAVSVNQTKGIVTVKTPDQTFRADACVCTAPVNSLLKIKFTPDLPIVQRQAAEKLQYARICKNSVLYSQRF